MSVKVTSRFRKQCRRETELQAAQTDIQAYREYREARTHQLKPQKSVVTGTATATVQRGRRPSYVGG